MAKLLQLWAAESQPLCGACPGWRHALHQKGSALLLLVLTSMAFLDSQIAV